MTGYRAFSYQFVKTPPGAVPRFEIETEMTIHALQRNMQVENVVIDYRDRPEGSESKLNTYSDGFKVLGTIARLFKKLSPVSILRHPGGSAGRVRHRLYDPCAERVLPHRPCAPLPDFDRLLLCAGGGAAAVHLRHYPVQPACQAMPAILSSSCKLCSIGVTAQKRRTEMQYDYLIVGAGLFGAVFCPRGHRRRQKVPGHR